MKDALDKYDIHRCNTKFGFQKPNTTKITASSTSASFHHPSVPPPTTSAQSSQPKSQQAEQHNQRGAPSHNHPARNNKNIAPQQYQNQRQPVQQAHQHQQQQRQPEGKNNSNSYSSTNSGSSNLHRQNQQHQAYSMKSHPPKLTEPSNNYQQKQKQSTNPDIMSSNKIPQQPHNGPNAKSYPTGMATSAVDRPTSSYGRRPTMGSYNSTNTNHSSCISTNIASSGTRSATASVSTGQSINPNDDTHNNSRIVSMEQNTTQQQHRRQPSSTHAPHLSMSSVDTNAHTVSQAPSMHGSVSSNSYNNPNHKRPPLGAISHNPTASGFTSESYSKRPKQQRHHNPYNHSLSGRKSI